MKHINKHYDSKLDQKMAEFDEQHTKSQSQMDEIEKYISVYEKRDNPDADKQQPKDELWD